MGYGRDTGCLVGNGKDSGRVQYSLSLDIECLGS